MTATVARPPRSPAPPSKHSWVGVLAAPLLIVVRTLVSAAVGALLAVVIRKAMGDDLIPMTDIVGNTTFANFNSPVYFLNYFLVVIVFPVATIATFAGLGRLPSRLVGTGVRRPFVDVEEPSNAGSWLLRTGFIGGLWGSAAVIALDVHGAGLTAIVACIALGYVVAVSAAATRWRRRIGVTRRAARAGLNVFGAAASLMALAVASLSSAVSIADSGETTQYPWLPIPVVAVGVACAIAVVARRLRATDPESWHDLERSSLAFVAGPTALVLFVARLPVDLGNPDLFHEGEGLAASRLVGAGAYPWRDILFIHGVLEDVIFPSIGRAVFEDSRWGSYAGQFAIVKPAYWLSNYFLSLYLFRRDLLLLFASQLVIVLGLYTDPHDRMVLVPAMLLALAALLIRPTWPRAALFTGLGILNAAIAPEAAFFTAAAGLVVMGYETAHHESGTRLRAGFRRVEMCLITGVAGLSLVGAYLASQRALDEFLDYYRTFSGSHEMTGALPMQWGEAEYGFWVIAPVTLILLAWLYGTARFVQRRELPVQDWVVGAVIVGLIPYYTKFLARADGHVFHVASMALMPLLYVCYRVVTTLERYLRVGLRWIGLASGRILPFAVIAALMWLAPVSPGAAVAGLPERYAAQAEATPFLPRLGYDAGTFPVGLVRDVKDTADRYLEDGDTMFDFTNSPALFWYLLDEPLATRFYHVSMAIRQRTQAQLIDELEAARPKLVAFDSAKTGMPVWDDITNAVRHYDVSDYLLDHYQPVTEVRGYVFLLRDDVTPIPPTDPELYLATRACDWGYVPEHFALAPTGARHPVPVASSDVVAIDGAGWVYDEATNDIPEEVVVTWQGRVVLRVPTGVRRSDVVTALRRKKSLRSGFEIRGGVIDGELPPDELRLFAIIHGVAAPFGAEAARTVSGALIDTDGSTIPIRSQPVAGILDRLESGGAVRSVELAATDRSMDWAVVGHGALRKDERFTLGDGSGSPSHTISFRALPGPAGTSSVMVGACAQWRGFAGGSMFLVSESGHPVDTFALVGGDP